MTAKRSLIGSKIGVFGKGGAGKSTVVAMLARSLVRCGYTACVLDADSTNLGLERALGCERAPDLLLEHLGGAVFEGGAVTCPVDDPTPLAHERISVSDLPPQLVSRPAPGLFLFRAGKLAGTAAGSGCDGPIAKIARDVRFSTDGADPVTIVDFKAGFEDAARGVITAMDWVIVVLDPTYASLEFAGHMRVMEEQLRIGTLPATKHLEDPTLVAAANRAFQHAALRGLVFILNKVLDGAMKGYLFDKLATKGIVPSAVLYHTPSIAQSCLQGGALDPRPVKTEIDRIVSALEQRASTSAT
jgi:CO dehydrogenase maturation factor